MRPLIIFIIINNLIFAQTDYYWSGNKKMPLKVIPNKKFIRISTKDTFNLAKNDSLIIEKIFNFDEVSSTNQSKSEKKILVKVKFNSKKLKNDKIKNAVIENPIFEGFQGKELLLSSNKSNLL